MYNLRKHLIFLFSLLMIGIIWWFVYLIFIFPKYHYDLLDNKFNENSAIVVFTGGKGRFEKGFNILKDNVSSRLFISGVYPGRDLEKKYALDDSDRKLFDCCISFDEKAINTIENVQEVREWVNVNAINEIFLISSYYHLPRIKILFEKMIPSLEVKIIPTDDSLFLSKKTFVYFFHIKLILTEYFKVLFILFFGI